MVAAIKKGLSLTDFEHLTIGMIIDYCVEWNEWENGEDREVEATQEDFNKF